MMPCPSCGEMINNTPAKECEACGWGKPPQALKSKQANKRKWRQNKTVAFDVDMTLIDHEDRPIYKNINLMRWFIDLGYDVIIWSGGGLDWAEMWARKLGFEEEVRVIEKGSIEVDIAFDDQAVNLGKVNIEV